MTCKMCGQALTYKSALSVVNKPVFNNEHYCTESCAILHKEAVRQGAPKRVAVFLQEAKRNSSEPLPYPNGKPKTYDYEWQLKAEMSLSEWSAYLGSLDESL